MKTPVVKPSPRACRQRASKQLRAEVLGAQKFRCLGCNAKLIDVEFDHVIPLALGGLNAPDNWAALCGRCHRAKTVEDLRTIAKAKRQRRFHETGRSRAPLKFGGFNKRLKRHLNGAVTTRCTCPSCRGKAGHNGYD